MIELIISNYLFSILIAMMVLVVAGNDLPERETIRYACLWPWYLVLFLIKRIK